MRLQKLKRTLEVSFEDQSVSTVGHSTAWALHCRLRHGAAVRGRGDSFLEKSVGGGENLINCRQENPLSRLFEVFGGGEIDKSLSHFRVPVE